MCELLDRIWSRPREEWARALRKELPSIADEVVEVLQQTLSGRHPAAQDTSREETKWAVEQGLLTALGYQHHPRHTRPTREPVAAPVPIDRARRTLFAAVTREPTPVQTSLGELSRAARWPLPERVRAVVLASPGEAAQLAVDLGDTLLGLPGGEACLLVPDQGADTGRALEKALRGRYAAVGHAVPLSDAGASLRWARRLLALAPVRPTTETFFVDDHLTLLLLLQDESLARALAARWLGPLEELTPRQCERLESTLLAWLEGGGAPEAARTLKVHPQTVRYRLRQIEKLFGPALRDPHARFELEMSLRSRRLLAQARRYTKPARRPRAATAGVRPLGMARQARVNGL